MTIIRMIIVALLLTICSLKATPFDYSFLNGLKIGIPKEQTFEILNRDSVEFIEKNNESGGKFTSLIPNFKFDNYKIDEIRLVFNKKKKLELILLLMNYKHLWEIVDKYTVSANCQFKSDETGTRYYSFDNCDIHISIENNYLSINPKSIKCK